MSKKIGILTYHRSINYGAFLQAYALCVESQKILGEKGKVEIIDYESRKAFEVYYKGYSIDNKRLYKRFRHALHRIAISKRHVVTDDLSVAIAFLKKQKYDLIIVGSDEVWRVNGMRGFPNLYWIPDNNFDTRRIAYGVSSRSKCEYISDTYKRIMTESLKHFEYIGVRDLETKRLIESFERFDAHMNCDPVFLHDFGFDKNYRTKLYKKHNLKTDKKLFVVMIPDTRLVQLVKRHFCDEYYFVALYDKHEFADVDLTYIDPFEWVKVISNADFVVTNRFHGTCFAIKYNISFLALDNCGELDTSKIFDLLQKCNLERFYCSYQEYQTDEKRRGIIEQIDPVRKEGYDSKAAMDKMIEYSRSYFDYLREVKL